MTSVDIRQSVTTILDDSLNLMQGYEYDEFGNQTVSGNASFLNEVTFTGAIADSTGLYYMNARFYNPNTGRFLTQDTYTGNAYEPWSQHLYSYTGNNPVNYVDPTGHIVLNALLGFAGAVIGAAVGAATTMVYDYMDDGQLNSQRSDYWSAIAGGAVAGGIIGATAGAGTGTAIAAYAAVGATFGAAAVESIVDETLEYALGEEPLTGENLVTSGKTIVLDTIFYGGLSFLMGRIKVPLSPGRFPTKSLFKCFFGPKAKQLFITPLLYDIPAELGLDFAIDAVVSQPENESNGYYVENTSIGSSSASTENNYTKPTSDSTSSTNVYSGGSGGGGTFYSYAY